MKLGPRSLRLQNGAPIITTWLLDQSELCIRCDVLSMNFVVSDVKESVKKRPKKDNNLYEVEIKEVDRQNKRIRIHFKGYDARFDEWRPYDQDGEYFPFVRWEKPHVLTSSSLNDRADHFIDMLFRG